MKPALALALVTISLCVAVPDAADAAVTAKQKGAKLVVLGDESADVIHVDGTGALGEVAVLAGTPPLLVESFVGIRDIEVKTGAGDDTINVSCLEIGGSFKAKLGAGDDTIAMDTTLADAVTNRQVLIGGSVDVSLGGQIADSFHCSPSAFEPSIYIGKNLTVRGAAKARVDGFGGSAATEPANVFVGGNLSIGFGNHPGRLTFDDVNVGGNTRLEFGPGADESFISDSQFVRAFTAKYGAGNDSLDFDEAESKFAASAQFDGGGGTDTMVKLTKLEFAALPTIKKFEDHP